MDTVQLSMHNIAFASSLQKELQQLANCQVVSVKSPDLSGKGLVILDEETLDGLPVPVSSPERILLVTRNETLKLKRAWEQGIVTVVFEHDPPHTVCLAAQAALLRLHNPHRQNPGCVVSPRQPKVPPIIGRTAATPVGPSSGTLKNQAL